MESKPMQPMADKRDAEMEILLPPVDAAVEIIITDDEQAAYLEVQPPQNGGLDLSYEKLVAALQKRRVLYGVKDDVLRQMADAPSYHTRVLIAQGALPVQGSDAELTFHFNLNRETKPKVRADGTVDYRDLGMIEAVVIGQKLCTLIPADKGTSGRTVAGRALLPNPVRSFGLPAGKNTRISDDKLELMAAINGSAEYVNGKVLVSNVYTVNGDVCNATGNISFDGSVVVNGDVHSGFSVNASGNINIVGNVEGATLDAGGDIKIVAGLVGQGRGRVTCGGNFKALFVENAEVFAKGDVTADVFMHAQLSCVGSVIAEGKRGAIIGGTCIAGKDVKALTVGSQSGTVTIFELGVDPTLVDRLKFIKDRTGMLSMELKKLGQIIQLLYPLKQTGRLMADKAEMLEKAIVTKSNFETELAALETEHEGYCTAMSGLSTSQLTCKRELYFGTKITIGSIVYVVPSDLVRCRLSLNSSGEIALSQIK